MIASHAIKQGPAEKLVGLTLLGQWTVKEKIQHDPGDEGQSRSSFYRAVGQDGRAAFVKAFDFRHEDMHGDIDRLEHMVREFANERRVHELCTKHSLSRVTTIYGSGKVTVDDFPVNFLICEYADGSMRELQPPGCPSIPPYLRLIGLRQVASALAQLHSVGVAHQDVKPSNAVHFNGDTLKISDLGSSSCTQFDAPPHDELSFAGQPNYAPYELLYGDKSSIWYNRRIGCDLFLLGNLVFTSFVGHSLSYLVMHGISENLRYTEGPRDYREALPDLVASHYQVVPDFLRVMAPECIAEDLIDMVLAMCHPDPALRGHPKNLLSPKAQFSVERFVSKLDALAKKARIESNVQAT